jgi:hypothetical protein
VPFLDPDDRVRRQRLLVVGFGKGRGAIKVDNRLVDTYQRWFLGWIPASAMLFLPFWKLIPAAAFLAALLAVVFRWLATSGRLVAGVTTGVVGMVVALMAPVSLWRPLPFVAAMVAAVGAGWVASAPVSSWVDADRPFSYWWAVLRAEVTAARPFPKESA